MTDAVAGAEHHHHEEIEKIETISSTATPWGVRLAFGIAGLLLLAGAFVAWQFRGALNGEVAAAMPWIIAAAVLLGAGAIMESVTTEIWLALIAGIFLLLIAFVIVGRVTIYPGLNWSIYVVDRFTGEVEHCSADACKVLPRTGEFMAPPKVQVPGR
ncbi:MAG TPA: hypothetical protein VMU01_08805 [Rhizomicrobium sp.]|nr:hypothetical protein [Rhizomicrobium sp.]